MVRTRWDNQLDKSVKLNAMLTFFCPDIPDTKRTTRRLKSWIYYIWAIFSLSVPRFLASIYTYFQTYFLTKTSESSESSERERERGCVYMYVCIMIENEKKRKENKQKEKRKGCRYAMLHCLTVRCFPQSVSRPWTVLSFLLPSRPSQSPVFYAVLSYLVLSFAVNISISIYHPLISRPLRIDGLIKILSWHWFCYAAAFAAFCFSFFRCPFFRFDFAFRFGCFLLLLLSFCCFCFTCVSLSFLSFPFLLSFPIVLVPFLPGQICVYAKLCSIEFSSIDLFLSASIFVSDRIKWVSLNLESARRWDGMGLSTWSSLFLFLYMNWRF